VKRTYLSFAAAIVLALLPSIVKAASGDFDVTPLNNKDILLMVQNHLPTTDIVNAIKSSPCTFDTFPPVLRELKRKGVPEMVLEAMIEAPYGPSALNSSRDDLGEQPIYHYTDQLKQMGFVTPTIGTSSRYPRRQNTRTRATRTRIRS
jgi:hypothetical protein